MTLEKQSDMFRYNFIVWRIIGIWPGRKKNFFYSCYTCSFLWISLFFYVMLMFLDLVYTPLSIELLISQLMYCFTEMTVFTKTLTIIFKHGEIVEIFDILDDKNLRAVDEKSESLMRQYHVSYKSIFKFYIIFTNMSLFFQVFVPLFLWLIMGYELELPACKYYFMSDEVRDQYFWLWYIYQAWGMYVHTMYNVSGDAFFTGLMLIAVNQLKIIEHQFFQLRLETSEKVLSFDKQDQIQVKRLTNILKRFDYLLTFCFKIEKLLSLTMFILFAMSSINICISLCGLLLPCTFGIFIGYLIYLLYLTIQIFIPTYLGTQMALTSSELAFAAYNSEWIPRPESFKKSITIFMIRANKPIQMTGLKLFPLTLSTFTQIMKSSYSIFTLVRSFQK